MAVETHIYDQRFFKNTIKLESSSAKAAVNILIKHFHPQSVIDIGCGAGIYLKGFSERGVKIKGIDGSPAAKKESPVRGKIKIYDLCRPLSLKKQFALCLCFEVAEHLPAQCAPTLVDTLTKASPLIVFTAATPGQGPRSIGHINEQPREYWIEKFKAKNFILDKKLTARIKKEMKTKKVVWWIAKNLMVFKRITNYKSNTNITNFISRCLF
ncbi:MAG: methyltransferase domain-containing protein [Patescibacteria group bacterium]|nr:methyltransferase domain-containing protein [Patescibacteria group bacterium]